MSQLTFLPVGTVLKNTYRIERHLASGGFGKTYLAYHLTLERNVVVKEFFMQGVNQREDNSSFVSIGVEENQELFKSQMEKFKKEAHRLFALKNDHIVSVYDLFDENQTSYYVMEYVEGESLDEMFKKQGTPLPEQQVLDITLQVVDALNVIHKEKLWHMDIKPGNIMIDKNGLCKLIDFGSSKQTDINGKNTATALTYTPGFAPMEQVSGAKEHWGPWTDFYALGATLYYLLTGKRPPAETDITVQGDAAFQYDTPVSPQTKSLVRWLMQPVYTQRPQFGDAIIRTIRQYYPAPVANPQSANAQQEQTMVMTQPINTLPSAAPITSQTITQPSTPNPVPVAPVSVPNPTPAVNQPVEAYATEPIPNAKRSNAPYIWTIILLLLLLGGGAAAYFLLLNKSKDEKPADDIEQKTMEDRPIKAEENLYEDDEFDIDGEEENEFEVEEDNADEEQQLLDERMAFCNQVMKNLRNATDTDEVDRIMDSFNEKAADSENGLSGDFYNQYRKKVDDVNKFAEKRINDILDQNKKDEERRAAELQRQKEEEQRRQSEEKQQYEDNSIQEVVEVQPEYPGGVSAMMNFISQNLQYPVAAMEQGITGMVVLKFLVEKNGSISQVLVTKTLYPDCDKEAVRVIKSMPRWSPGKLKGVPVRCWFTIPIRFQLQ